MTFKNYTSQAIFELERQRTDNYGMDYEDYNQKNECEECKTPTKQRYNGNSHIYCTDCILEHLRQAFFDVSQTIDDNFIASGEILEDIISDFSDSELLCYVDNRYEKIEY